MWKPRAWIHPTFSQVIMSHLIKHKPERFTRKKCTCTYTNTWWTCCTDKFRNAYSTHTHTHAHIQTHAHCVSAAPVARLNIVYMESYAHTKSKVPQEGTLQSPLQSAVYCDGTEAMNSKQAQEMSLSNVLYSESSQLSCAVSISLSLSLLQGNSPNSHSRVRLPSSVPAIRLYSS